MCGIVGLLVKKPALRDQLGELMVPMLDRHDRARAGIGRAGGIHRASRRTASQVQPVLRRARAIDWARARAASRRANSEADTSSACTANHAVLKRAAIPTQVKAWLTTQLPEYHLLSVGRSIDLYKDIGTPGEVAAALRFPSLQGTHLVGHTRMATESAVTPAHAHPFTAGEDFCLVHNGSLSNPYSVRRKLEPLGIKFETDNDTEAACRFLEWRMREGDDLDDGAGNGLRRARRLLYVPDGHATTSWRWSATRSRASRRWSPRPTITSRSRRNSARSRSCPASRTPACSSPSRSEIYLWRA